MNVSHLIPTPPFLFLFSLSFGHCRLLRKPSGTITPNSRSRLLFVSSFNKCTPLFGTALSGATLELTLHTNLPSLFTFMLDRSGCACLPLLKVAKERRREEEKCKISQKHFICRVRASCKKYIIITLFHKIRKKRRPPLNIFYRLHGQSKLLDPSSVSFNILVRALFQVSSGLLQSQRNNREAT